MTTSSPFSKQFILEQKELLLSLKEEIIEAMRARLLDEDLKVQQEETSEDGDIAQSSLNQNLAIGLKEKDLYKLREIEAALKRIETGHYGICEETDEPIGESRLRKIPWTRYSIQAAEEIERQQQGMRKAS